MPKTKKRGKGGKGEKEKPLLTVQGVLRLERSFITAQHEGAQTMEVKKSEDAPKETIKLIPGDSEHDLVQYKAGYALGPENPNPTNEVESEIFAAENAVREREERFRDMKEATERARKEREDKFKEEELKRKKMLAGLNDEPPGDEDSLKTGPLLEESRSQEPWDADDPRNYLPPSIVADPAFHNDQPLKFGTSQPPQQPAKPDENPEASPSVETSKDVVLVDPSNAGEECLPNVPESEMPQMKPLPEGKPIPSSSSSSSGNLADMALQVALEVEEKRKKEVRDKLIQAEERGDKVTDETIYSLDEITAMSSEDQINQKLVQGPELPAEQKDELIRAQHQNDLKQVLNHYWQFVRENPQDFNGWCYLIQHVENIDDMDEVRSVYNAFLPLYPYCYAYWQRYSDIEKKHDNWQRSLAILHRGLEAIPLSVDLWISYLELYYKMYHDHTNFTDLFRTQCERAIHTVGLEYRSDALWERYIEWELEQKNLRWVTNIYKRLVAIPTKLYNKHWDNFIAHIRDHHPRDILEYDEYDELRKITCKELDLTYRPDPIIAPTKPREVVQPEDKLKAGMKERVVASVVSDHEKCEEELDKRYRYEEKIKRTYFHVKPVDLKQIKNWDAYLDFEISEGNHERIVVLFERCLIPCAHYEEFWAKYARYLECYHKDRETKGLSNDGQDGDLNADSVLKKAKWLFGTGLVTVEEMREKRCAWTLRGWKDKDKDGKEIMRAEEVHVEDSVPSDKNISEDKKQAEAEETKGEEEKSGDKEDDGDGDEKESGNSQGNEQSLIDSEMSLVCKTSWEGKGRQAVRDVYNRACLVHCQRKAMIRLRWAAFEEDSGDHEKAKEILMRLRDAYPLLLECRIQIIDIERRLGNLDRAEEEYKSLIKKVPKNRNSIRTWLSIKLARFQFKVKGQADKALATLRAALKKEKGDPRLFAQIIDVCYQRHPVDVGGVTAAIELAIKSGELTNMQKLEFVKRKVEFMQEFGDVKRYRDACDQIKQFRKLCAVDLKAEAKKRKELEKEELKLKELESIKAQARADANMKAKVAEIEGRLLCTGCQSEMYPNAQGVYEFEGFRPGQAVSSRQNGAKKADQSPEGGVEDDPDDGVLDLMDLVIPEDQEEQIRKTLEEKTKYKEVAPTWELNMESYGYGKRKRAYDPDYEHVETARFKEYERLEIQGLAEELKDPDHDKLRNINAPGLGSTDLETGKRRKLNEEKRAAYTTSDYVVPPKVPQLLMGSGVVPRNPRKQFGNNSQNDAPGAEALPIFELPPEVSNLQTSPCVNVPEWFVKEGGELCLSDTANGMSRIRYWPKFLSDKGNHLMFNRMRKYVKWHQKQMKIGGEWKYATRLVAWYGPCDYNYLGLNLERNPNWCPELLDLLHRLMAMTRQDFNSCFLNLYRHGHDMCGWHADVHPQLGRNPSVASVSLGAVRVFEFRKKSGPPNFLRFPLFPGSLLLMEGATQEDWLHCLPRDPVCKEERINLTFRTMYSLNRR